MTVAATIEIEAQAPAWRALLLLVHWRRLAIEIDGERGRLRWGTHAFVVAPGEHEVRVGLGVATVKAAIKVQIGASETVRLRYTPALIRHLPGTLERVQLPSARVINGTK